MSSMGTLAREYVAGLKRGVSAEVAPRPKDRDCADGNLRCFGAPTVGLGGTQAEVSIAVDATGQHVVIGFNDFRGFFKDPVSVSGFMYSDNGGATFVDGGQLPSPGDQILFGQKWPQIFGDPAVKYLGGCNFIYASLMVKVTGKGLAQTLSIHKSTDCGHTWTGPVEVTPATNPNGLVDVGENALDAADKELIDVDPETGRVIFGWANYTPVVPGGIEMSSTYTDNILSANPAFAPRRVVASAVPDGQGASIQFAGNGSQNVYFAWTRFTGPYTRRIAMSRSTDNGQTWSAPAELTGSFIGMDEVLGNDRVNEFPSVAVDNSAGPFKGNVYVVYSNNNSLDGADVLFQRSTDSGVTFSAPVAINSSPGNDRAQWFPFVTVDKTTGRVTVFYYDQGVDTSGHLTEVTYLYSDDGGSTWSRPAPLTDRPFKAGWGNDTGQPNLGDYNQAVAQFGTLYAAYAATRQPRYTEGQPSVVFDTPDVFMSKVSTGTLKLPLRLSTVSFAESGGNGNLDPGDSATFKVALRNSDTNPLHAGTVSAITAILISTTPGVSVTQAASAYPNLSPGATAVNSTDYAVKLSPAFLPGTPIEFELAITANGGTTKLRHTQSTGTLLRTTLLSENFDGVPAGVLPPGWTSAHGAGDNSVPWTSSKTFCGTSNKAFHQNADDRPVNGSPARWERLFSPVVAIPADAQSVEVEFDVCFDTEDDPNLRYLAYDGFFLRVTDLTPGRTLRSVLAEAFEQEFTTGSIKHYPRHLPRSGDPRYFENMSAWAGDSGGYRRVRMKLPGMEGSQVQFRFEFTQDSLFTCADVRPGRTCGVAVDNFVVRSVRAVAPPSVRLILQPQLSRDEANNIVARITVTNNGAAPANNVRLTEVVLGTTPTTSALPVPGAIAPGGSAVAVVRFPSSAGTPGAASVLRIDGLYDGGTFGGNLRVTIP
jgi:hypothetical protein